jgi:hypothetical protein
MGRRRARTKSRSTLPVNPGLAGRPQAGLSSPQRRKNLGVVGPARELIVENGELVLSRWATSDQSNGSDLRPELKCPPIAFMLFHDLLKPLKGSLELRL